MRRIELAIVGDIAWNQDITPHGEATSPGGAAYYSAVGASHFSEFVGAVAKVGTDFDVSLLTSRGVDVEGVKVIRGGKTCRFVLTQYSDNTRSFEAQRGVAGTVETKIFPNRYLTAQFIHLPTQLPEHALTWLDFLDTHPGVSVDTFEAFVKDFPELTRRMLQKANIIFTNEAEVNMLRNLGGFIFDKPIILKKDKDGAVYMHNNEIVTVPAPNVTVVDTTGAGDVLAGAFLAQRAQGVPLTVALEKAVQTASHSVTQFGVEHIMPRKLNHS